jgi:hypothetical protein
MTRRISRRQWFFGLTAGLFGVGIASAAPDEKSRRAHAQSEAPSSREDALGRRTTYVFDARGRCLYSIGGDGIRRNHRSYESA